MGAMQLAIAVKVCLVASVALLVSAVKTPDELEALRTQNPHAYDVVQSLLLKNKMGVLNPRHPSIALSTPQEEEPRQAGEEDDVQQSSGLPSMPEALDVRRPSALLSMTKQDVRQANQDVALYTPAPATQGLSADWMSTRPGNEEEVQGVMRKIEDLTGKSASRQQTLGMPSESNDLLGDAGPALFGSPPAQALTRTDSQFSSPANPYLADLLEPRSRNTATTGMVADREQRVAPAARDTSYEQHQSPDEVQALFPKSSSQDAEEEAMFEEALGLAKTKSTERHEGEQNLSQHAASAPVEMHPIKSSADPYYTALKLTKPQVMEADVVQDKSGAVASARSGGLAKHDAENQPRSSASQDSNTGNPYLEGLSLDIHDVQPRKEASAAGNPYLQGFDLDIHDAPDANPARSLLRKPDQAMAQSRPSNEKPSDHWKDKLSRWLNS